VGSAARRAGDGLSAKGYSWFWPKIASALTSKHHWLVINCDSCGTVVDLDLRVKPRDLDASIRVALCDVRCPRCNGHGRPRIIALAWHPSIRTPWGHLASKFVSGLPLVPQVLFALYSLLAS
jgi:hypothetical protein